MHEAPLPSNEPQRLHALHRYQILDSSSDDAFNELANLAAEICQTPIALVSMVDEARQWFKARVGLDVKETARSVSFCAHAILQDELFIIPDTLKDERFLDNPLVTGPPNIRFYAGAPLFTKEGYGLGTLCVIDKKPRKLTSAQEKTLRVLRRHVHTLMTLHRQTQELRALNEELDLFNSAVSHDLIAPVRRIFGFCQVLEEDYAAALGGEGLQVVRRTQNAADHMQNLVNGLASLTRITQANLRMEKINLSYLAVEILTALEKNASQRVLKYHIDPDVYVYADPRLLRIVLENLLGNAWKFTENREITRIDVGVEKRHEKRLIYVRDNGVGFDMNRAERLFAPFYRLHSEEQFKGLGIGLSTVYRIVHRHGGEIYGESAPEKGTTFYFTL